ncbi:MAG: hypothetical protein NWE93_09345 [Candidatus Bathyarchaeota archaeon]|nr:hypothetical protein [Candidatus Bathyarchaeota archaeon]
MVKIVANRNVPEIKLAGLTVGPFDEGNDYEIYFWVAKELASVGLVHFREEDMLDGTKLNRAQWKELSSIPGQISELPSEFYPKVRRFLRDLKDQAAQTQQSEKFQEYDRTKHLARDITNLRLKKIVALAAGPGQGEQVIGKLTKEEKILYEQLVKIISQWKARILENGADKQ